MHSERKWKLQQIQNKALRLATMMRRDSLKSALKACVFTPFCLSTFSAICSLVLAERMWPSTLRAKRTNMAAEPGNKDCTLNAHTIPFCMHSAFAFQEGCCCCCCCCCCCWRAVARLHFRQRPRQGRHDRCYRCSRGLLPKATKNIAMHPPAGQHQPPKLEAHFAMLCSSMAQTPPHSFQNICHGRRCFCLLLRNRPQCFAIGVPPQTTSVSHTQPAPEKTHLPLENKQKQQATQNRCKSTRLMHNHPKLRSRH
jgi:hypothetical protein